MIEPMARADDSVSGDLHNGIVQTGKKVLVVSENFGTGHTKAAEALAKGLRSEHRGIEVQMVELGRELQPKVSRFLLSSYLNIIRKTPQVWKMLYGRHHTRSFPQWLQWCIYRTLYTRLAAYIEEIRPDLVVSTHPFASSGVARLKRQGLSTILCTLVTDFSAHGAWIHPETDRYLVTHKGVRRQMVGMGVRPERILTTGIPTDRRFWKKQNQREVRERMGLKQMSTLLILGGGLGLGGTDRVVRAAAKWKEELQILVCTGYNRQLKESLERDGELRHPHIRITGFTTQMADWMDAADLIVSKPGGMTCTEAIAKEKPLLIYGTIPGHEERNGQFMLEQGLAEKADDDDELDCWFQRLVSGDLPLDRLRERMMVWRERIHPSHSVQAVLEMLTS